MLEDAERAEVWQLYEAALRSLKAPKIDHAQDTPEVVRERFAPVRAALERLTCVQHEDNYDHAVMHHRLSLYGPPCAACDKPLRTPRARHCAACGTAVASIPTAGEHASEPDGLPSA